MKLMFRILAMAVLISCAGSMAYSQDKRVNVRKLEVDGQPVKTAFKVTIITADGKAHKAKTDSTGFTVPAEVLRSNQDELVGVVISFRKYVLMFFTVHTSNFNTDWLVVGIDHEPFEKENIGDANPADTESVSYIRFAGEPERSLTVRKSKPKVTINRVGR